MRSRIHAYSGCVLLLIGGACSDAPVDTTEVLRPVRSQQVIATGVRRVRTFSGTARAGVESKLSFRIAGTIQRIGVTVGDRVRTGHLLAELDPTDARLRADAAAASLAQARASQRSAEAEYERVRGLYENDNASKSDLDRTRANAEAAQAQVRSLEAQLQQSERQLGYTRLEAPVAGSIAILAAERNENVQAGQTVVILTSGSRPEVEVAIPGSLISEVNRGDRVTVRFPALPGEQLSGVVTEVAVAAINNATTFPVTIRLEDSSSVRPGMAATVDMRFGSEDGAERIYLPPVAVGEDNGGRFVFVLEDQEDGVATVRRRSVEIGDLTADGIEIVSGLTEGEPVVTAGVRRLEDGRRVRSGSVEGGS